MLLFEILLAGLFWFLALAFILRFGFYNYCLWRSVGQQGGDGLAAYRANKDRLFSRAWLLSSLGSAALVASGLISLKVYEGREGIEMIGLIGSLAGFGLGIISSLHRITKLYSDKSRARQ